MNNQQSQQKLEQFRLEAAMRHALGEIRRQHVKNLINAAQTLLLELRALTIGSLEIPGNKRVQHHV